MSTYADELAETLGQMHGEGTTQSIGWSECVMMSELVDALNDHPVAEVLIEIDRAALHPILAKIKSPLEEHREEAVGDLLELTAQLVPVVIRDEDNGSHIVIHATSIDLARPVILKATFGFEVGQRVELTGNGWHEYGLYGSVVTIAERAAVNGEGPVFEAQGSRWGIHSHPDNGDYSAKLAKEPIAYKVGDRVLLAGVCFGPDWNKVVTVTAIAEDEDAAIFQIDGKEGRVYYRPNDGGYYGELAAEGQ